MVAERRVVHVRDVADLCPVKGRVEGFHRPGQLRRGERDAGQGGVLHLIVVLQRVPSGTDDRDVPHVAGQRDDVVHGMRADGAEENVDVFLNV